MWLHHFTAPETVQRCLKHWNRDLAYDPAIPPKGT